MKIENSYSNKVYNTKNKYNSNYIKYDLNSVQDKLELNLIKQKSDISFSGNPIKSVMDFFRYIKVQKYVNGLNLYIEKQQNYESLPFRNLSMEALEGLQYGIEVFKGLSMKDIQYLSENLHVIAVKRGCNNMCGYCYADAKPSKREMSWEDFTLITNGFKTIRKRLGKLPLFGENLPTAKDLIYKTTELFYDADCMNIAIKDKKGKIYDMRDLVTEVYESVGRTSCFDTSGWNPNNKLLQERAEQYAEYFSKPENMKKLTVFNLSFNVFNASYVSGVKSLKAGDVERYQRLKDKFVDRIANAVYTFTPLLENEKFTVLTRAFGLESQNAGNFGFTAMFGLINDVSKKVEMLYKADLNGAKKYIKTPEDLKKYTDLAFNKINGIDTGLNPSGRMKQFMETFKIKDKSMQNHDPYVKPLYEDLSGLGRFHRTLAHRLIDTDGKVYHMNYAMFFPTEIQLNIKDKTPTPKLANLKEEFLITKEMINRKEVPCSVNDVL